jgi:hypothetical protein
MNLSIKELNDLFYCVGKVRMYEGVKFMSNEELDKLSDKIWDEIVKVNNEEEERNKIINEMEDIM